MGSCLLQFHPKTTPFSNLGLDTHLATHSVYGFSDNRQPNPGTLIHSNSMQSLKHFEYALDATWWNPDAIILKPQPNHFPLAFRAHRHPRFRIGCHELHRIA